MKPIEIPALDAEQLAALDDLYRSTRNVRLKTRTQIVLLAAERRMIPTIKALIAAAYAFFEHYDRRPRDVLSIIGSNLAEIA
jgi:hypothetical protein